MYHVKRLLFFKLFLIALVLLGLGIWFSPGSVRESLLRLVFNVPPSMELKVDGRVAAVYLPDQIDTQRQFPLVIALHGYQSSPIENDYLFDLMEPRHELGYILMTPKGLVDRKGNRYWRAIPDCCNYELYDNDDVGFLKKLIRKAIEDLPVDPSHIILFGFSNGSYMGYRLLCEPNSQITHFVSFAGLGPENLDECETVAKATHIFHFHGLADERVRYNGDRHDASSVKDMMEFWARINQCSEELQQINGAIDLNHAIEGNETDLWQWSCDQAALKLYRMNGVGHVAWLNQAPLRLLWPEISASTSPPPAYNATKP